MKINHRFWYTDLSEDTGHPWFSCHLEIGVAPNGNPRFEIDKSFYSLKFWRIKLVIEATKRALKGNLSNGWQY